jgi:hypothetical protein
MEKLYENQMEKANWSERDTIKTTGENERENETDEVENEKHEREIYIVHKKRAHKREG